MSQAQMVHHASYGIVITVKMHGTEDSFHSLCHHSRRNGIFAMICCDTSVETMVEANLGKVGVAKVTIANCGPIS